MDKFGAAVTIGLVFGSAYALLALGLVLVYKGSRVFNFAQGEFGTIAAFALFIVNDTLGLPIVIGIVAALAAAVLMGLGVERFVVRPLAAAPRVTILVATAAVALGTIGAELWFGGGPEPRAMPSIIEGEAFNAFGNSVSWNRFLGVLALAGLAVALYLFFSRSDLGLAVLAAAQEPTATDLVGISTRRISSLVWALAAFLGGVAGVILAAGQTFFPGYLTSQFLIFGFVAAVVGGMTSLPGAVLGGVVLGLVEQLAATYLSTTSFFQDTLPGVNSLSVFVLLIAVLVVKPTGLLGREA